MRALTLVLLALVGACSTERFELFPGALPADGGIAEMSGGGATDLASACVCRLVICRANADCQSAIAPSSTCDPSSTCTGGGHSCAVAADCSANATGWICAQGPASTVACPSR